ncbi:cytochrome b5 domain-containing protein [Ammoniphilus sp. CFH 90114]|uniref:cytochrome b5 domain-containing protein n=1 Tax=Ammoniphilus sp. CFH 90114 TaxID=2493665 RepID=UPI00100EAF73|nr:cytochrome b5 domain-containing protein [Ammoniphilus sp. CFH 90114]RXT07950.1 cytochrome B5 [Ammoniphilus sp. CFH 90114]
MSQNKEVIQRQIQIAFSEVQYLIRLLYSTTDYHTKNLILNQLWNKVSLLHFLFTLSDQPTQTLPVTPTLPQPSHQALTAPSTQTQATTQSLPAITRDQLSENNGRNGKPAYVAVNGTVYDVTNNKAWSAASHFGLSAGKDLTAEFASCHAGQQWILNTLKPVGRLA